MTDVGQGTKVVAAFFSAWAWILLWVLFVSAWRWWLGRRD